MSNVNKILLIFTMRKIMKCFKIQQLSRNLWITRQISFFDNVDSPSPTFIIIETIV